MAGGLDLASVDALVVGDERALAGRELRTCAGTGLGADPFSEPGPPAVAARCGATSWTFPSMTLVASTASAVAGVTTTIWSLKAMAARAASRVTPGPCSAVPSVRHSSLSQRGSMSAAAVLTRTAIDPSASRPPS